jgi:hypothetical protein
MAAQAEPAVHYFRSEADVAARSDAEKSNLGTGRAPWLCIGCKVWNRK